ncbi:sensor domain-containing diguanylate cyclase [Natronospira bacteriovora]|uniref:Diguanylate cyclase n=1 Tax=Natronospira bacteriovora TaxID=3069753 RepID=A0ABU0W4S6_9GAMM|nr:GGDEF domain-containing protein [Natronospira sp. AB-CW4]MDQ2069001.1 diguanylate cyclase [Natronospira sp. AB-CW4]
MRRWLTANKPPGGWIQGGGSNTRQLMISGLGGIVVLLILALGASWGLLETKSALRAYATSESHWSKGKEDALHALSVYARTGEPEMLEQAREAIAGPAGYMQARLSLEREPVDLERAWQGFEQGGSHEDDIPRLIWMFRYFQNVSHFRQAASIWRATDEHILYLEALSQPPQTAAAAEERQAEILASLGETRQVLREKETAFLRTLGQVDREVTRSLFITVALALLLVALITMMLFRWAARRLSDSEQELRATLEHAGVGMAIVDDRGIIRYVNSRLCDILDYPSTMLVDSRLSSMPGNREEPIDIGIVRDQYDSSSNRSIVERQHLRNDDSPMWLRFTFSLTEKNQHGPYVLVVEDTSEERSQVEALAHEATHDALTGLLNRRAFSRRLDQTIASAHDDQTRHVLCFIDLDGFKAINDTCGHRAGDVFLMNISDVIRSNLREGDILARLGGDEFAIILSHCPLDAATGIVEKLRRHVENFRFRWELRQFHVTVSAGLVELGPNSGDALDILDAADTACYDAKKQGRNRVVIVTQGDERLTKPYR